MPVWYVSLWNWEVSSRNKPSGAQQGKIIKNRETPRKIRSVGIISIFQHKTTTSALSNLSVCLKVMFPVQHNFVPTWQHVFHITSYCSYSSSSWCLRTNIWTEYSDNVWLQVKNRQNIRQREKCLSYWCVFCVVVFCLMVWSWTEQLVASIPLCTTLCEYTEHTGRQSQTQKQTS